MASNGKKRPAEVSKADDPAKPVDVEMDLHLKKKRKAEKDLEIIKCEYDIIILNRKMRKLAAEMERDKKEPVKPAVKHKPIPKVPAAEVPKPPPAAPTGSSSSAAAAASVSGLPPPLPTLDTVPKRKPTQFRDIVLVIVMSDTKKHESSPSWLELCDLKGASGYGKEVMCAMQTKFRHPFNKALQYRIDSFMGDNTEIRFCRAKEDSGLNVLTFTATTHGLSPQLVLEVLEDFEYAFQEVMGPRLELEFGKQTESYFFTRIELSLVRARH